MVARTEDQASVAAPAPTSGSRSPRRLSVLAFLVGLVGVVAALALPFAPVSVDEPTVSWPEDPTAPTSTMLMLTAYRPASFDAGFTCRQVSRAAGTPGAVVLATTDPESTQGRAAGLMVTVGAGELSVASRGVVLFRGPVPPGPCRYTLASVGGDLVLSRDGRELGRGPVPDVDALTTSVTTAPDAVPGDLDVRLIVDNAFSTTPTPSKVVLLGVAVTGALAAVVLLFLVDRRAGRPPPAPRGPSGRRRAAPRAVGTLCDLAVVAAVGAWLFLAPPTPDDGYYAAMARNAGFEGYVGNYYQLYNQGFTPFTWVYQGLSWWQSLAGLAPVTQRIPALVLGLVTWACLRRFVTRTRRDAEDAAAPPGSWRAASTTVVLAVAFLAWWMPFDMGLRPETAVAACTAVSLLCVVLASERQSLLFAGAAVAASSLGATCAPSGFVALAPLVVGTPVLWTLLRGRGGPFEAIGRILCVLAPGVVGVVAAFADGSLRDFLRAQMLFQNAQEPETWFTEYLRWEMLLAPEAGYAYRAPVLVTVLAVAGFTVLWAAARSRRVPVPRRLLLSGMTVAVAFVLLWPTPSKWVMHFGTMAGVGAAFLALLVVEGPRVVHRLLGGRRAPRPALVAAAVAVVLVVSLAAHGRNHWWLADWTPLLPHADVPPQVWIVAFDQPLWWALGGLGAAVLFGLAARRRRPSWAALAPALAVPLVAVVFLGAVVAYMLGTFALQAARTADTWSLASQALRDPTASECGAGSRVDVADPVGAPLTVDPLASSATAPAVPGAAAPTGDGFAADAGWFTADPPPVPPVAPDSPTAWGSLLTRADRPGTSPESSTGRLETPWYSAPALSPDDVLTSLVAGRTGDGNSLTAEYGRRTPTGVEILEQRVLGESVHTEQPVSSTAWRSVALGTPGTMPADMDVVRLVLVDGRTDVGGWIAATAPRQSRFVPLDTVAAPGAPTAVSWQVALLFPCVRQPRIQNGITEPATWAIGYAGDPLQLLTDGTWQTGRGGVFGQTGRQADITQWLARMEGVPTIRSLQVYRFDQPYDTDAYRLEPGRRVVGGWEVDPPVATAVP